MDVADSNDAFQKLEDKLRRAVQVFKENQAERRTLERELDSLRADSRDRTKRIDALEREIQGLRRERDDVRRRIERLIEQLDALTNSDAGG